MAAKKRESVVNAQEDMFRRLNVKVSLDAYERLLLHAIKANRAPGAYVPHICPEFSPNFHPPIR